MGLYINTGNAGFVRARNSEYIDKSGLISVVNSTLFTERSFRRSHGDKRLGKAPVYDRKHGTLFQINR